MNSDNKYRKNNYHQPSDHDLSRQPLGVSGNPNYFTDNSFPPYQNFSSLYMYNNSMPPHLPGGTVSPAHLPPNSYGYYQQNFYDYRGTNPSMNERQGNYNFRGRPHDYRNNSSHRYGGKDWKRGGQQGHRNSYQSDGNSLKMDNFSSSCSEKDRTNSLVAGNSALNPGLNNYQQGSESVGEDDIEDKHGLSSEKKSDQFAAKAKVEGYYQHQNLPRNERGRGRGKRGVFRNKDRGFSNKQGGENFVTQKNHCDNKYKDESRMTSLKKLKDESENACSKNPETERLDNQQNFQGKSMNLDKGGPRNRNKPFKGNKTAVKSDESQRAMLIEQLSNNSYECMVCCELVKRHNPVWSCNNCYHVFHLRCIKKWARSPTAMTEDTGSGWRCPACQDTCHKFPSTYWCFCGKVRDPEYHHMETPHSCGTLCQKSRGDNCPHPCNELCHPGPCPPCYAIIQKSCDCGQTVQKKKCSSSQEIKCDKVCGKQLNCGRHHCDIVCHPGPCDPCTKTIIQECFKGHTSREVICGTKESFSESFACEDACHRTLACGNHTCERVCHEGECGDCILLPSHVSSCPCGKVLLEQLEEVPRASCLDPIPTCGDVCGKEMTCGPIDTRHKCPKKCHEGQCGPCEGETEVRCRCGALSKSFSCEEVSLFTEDKPFLCDKRCNKKRTCGRHRCGQHCCIRDAAEHTCDYICGQKLKCGLHKCDEPCHKGSCPPCLMASFDELTCHCGSEIIYPPIPCGTKPPECKNLCTRNHNCDHPVRHPCQSQSEENCPPCAELVSKFCMGEHELRKNIPCHIENISCGLPCNKDLPCEQHKCRRTCHSGECLSEQSCNQPCETLRECGHICGQPCHVGSPCPDSVCKQLITIKCACGYKCAKVPCQSGGAGTSNLQRFSMQTIAAGMASGALDMSQLTLNKDRQQQLECDETCSTYDRNKRLAEALDIKNPDLSSKLGCPNYTEFLRDYTKQYPHQVARVERALSELVQNAKSSKFAHRSHSFASMGMKERKMIHELAEFYGCETQSYDYEPKRNVVATAHKDKCCLPAITLTALIQREVNPKAPTPIPHNYSEDNIKKSAAAAKLSTKVYATAAKPAKSQEKSEKIIDYFDFS